MRTGMFCIFVLLATQVTWAVSKKEAAQASKTNAGKATVEVESFGKTPQGQDVALYRLQNAAGLRATVMEYGAILISLEAPDREGKSADIVLGFDKLDSYINRNPLFGATVGRYANRIANAGFTLDGVQYKLTANSGRNHIHGGKLGAFDKVVWKGSAFHNDEGAGVRLGHLSKDGEDGFPGNLNCTVTYTVTNKNELNIDYKATTDKATVVNMTNHSYFNLAGAGNGDVLKHVIMINADRYTAADQRLIPTGEIASVKDTALDFTQPKAIGARIEQLTETRGYDHNYVLNKANGRLCAAAQVYEPAGGRVMDVYTTEPGMQFYTANGMRGIRGKDGKVYDRHYGFCLETQHYPDSPNKPQFPSTVLRPGETYETVTIFRFSTR